MSQSHANKQAASVSERRFVFSKFCFYGFGVAGIGAGVGGRRRVDILCEKEFAALGWEVRVATEDGSHGEKGLVTQPLLTELRTPNSELRTPKLYACGPTPMLKAVAKIAEDFNLPCELSMDEHMCCGVGVCLTCVIPVKSGDGWEYQRTCTEGPVFDSRQIVWEKA